MFATTDGGYTYSSSDSGVTWTQKGPSVLSARALAADANVNNIVVAVGSGLIWTSQCR